MERYEFLNSKGEKVKLNAREKAVILALERQHAEILNALGIEIPITTLTTAIKSVAEQKFFQVAPADYLPVVVGEGSFGTDLLKYLSYNTAGDFEDGIIHQGVNSSKLAQADAAVDGLRIPIINWAKGLDWNLFNVQTAAKTGNWDIITEKEKSRKRNWDLGIQRVAFLGSEKVPALKGLLTLDNVNSDITTITKPISLMTATEYGTFVAKLLGAYRANCQYTAMPTDMYIPESDFNGLAAPLSADYPNTSKIEYLKNRVFSDLGLGKLNIKPLVYCQQTNNTLGLNRYVMLNKDADTLAMNIPVDYTATMANSINGFNWQNAAYGQFTGVKAYRPAEVLYFDYAN
jgi:hypothetical protein